MLRKLRAMPARHVTRLATMSFQRTSPVTTCPQGTTGAASYAAPPLASRVSGSLCRGGQGLWTLWTAGDVGIGEGLAGPAGLLQCNNLFCF